MIASGAGDRTVRLWNVENGINVVTIRIEDVVTGVAISPNCQLVAAGSLDNSVSFWNMQGHPIGRLQDPEGHQDLVYSVAFSPDNRLLVSGSLDRTVKVWELDSAGRGEINEHFEGGQYSSTFNGHKVSHYIPRPNNYLLISLSFRITFFLSL